MKFDKKTKIGLSNYLVYGGLLAIVMSMISWVGPNIWLTATQWLILSGVLVIFAIYLKLG